MTLQTLRNLLLKHFACFNNTPVDVEALVSAEEKLDTLFGITESKIDSNLTQTPFLYIDLKPVSLNSSYIDLMRFMQTFKAHSILDVGAGHGRLGFIIALLYPHIDYYASELVAERINPLVEFKLLYQLENIHVFNGDYLSDPHLSIVDDVYLYLPWEMVAGLIRQLIKMQKNMNMWVVESHGDVLTQLDSRVYCRRLSQLDLLLPRHHDQLNGFHFDFHSWQSQHFQFSRLLEVHQEDLLLCLLDKFQLADHDLDDYFLQCEQYLYSITGLQKDQKNYYLSRTNRYFYSHQSTYLVHKTKLNIPSNWLEKLHLGEILRIDWRNKTAEVSANNWNKI